MKLKAIEHDFTVCKVRDISQVDFNDEFCFLGKTDEEISLVCRSEKTPLNTVEREDGLRAFRIEGILDFSLVGILSRISAVMAENEIGIFALSTFNTDYVLVKKHNFERAVNALRGAGYEVSDTN